MHPTPVLTGHLRPETCQDLLNRLDVDRIEPLQMVEWWLLTLYRRRNLPGILALPVRDRIIRHLSG